MKNNQRQLVVQNLVKTTKILIWTFGITFIVIEAREVFELRQITNVAFFAITLAFASYQVVSSESLYKHSKKLSSRACKSSLTMYLASTLSALDAALDQAIAEFSEVLDASFLLIPVFYLSWLITSSAAILAIRSLCSFLDIFPIALASKNDWEFLSPEQDNTNQ